MSGKDHYKGPPKKREVRLNKDGDIESLSKDGDALLIFGAATLSGVADHGQFILEDARIKSTSSALVSANNNAIINLASVVSTGRLTVSCTSTGLVTYQVVI